METTRNGTVCLAPEGPVTPTPSSEPTWAWNWRMVAAPRPISPSPRGRFPATVDNSTGPRSDCTARVPTVVFSIETWVATTRVIPSTFPLCSILLTSPGSGSPGMTWKLSWYASP